MNIPFTPVLANLMGPQGLLIMFVLLLLFGAKKLPELAKGLGQAIREFSKAKNEIQDEIMREATAPTPPARQIETPVQTAATHPAGTQPAQQSATANEHSGTHA
jgi:TatA/E family protein of Tat protein translocase